MMGAVGGDSFTLQFVNYTWRSGKVKALKSDSPTLRTATRNSFKSSSTDWADRFKNADNSAWVDDGKTVPVAFGDNFLIEIKYATPSALYTFNHIIVNKTTFIQASKDISEGIFIQSGVADDWGMDVRYNAGNLIVPFNVYDDSGELWISFEIVTTASFASLGTFPEEVLDSGAVGAETNTVIDVVGVSGESYTQMTTAQNGTPLRVSDMTISTSDGLQALAPIEIKRSDVNGNEYTYFEIPTIDPYQFQNVTNIQTDITMDALTFIEVTMEGDSSSRITMDYGEEEYEPLSSLDIKDLMSSELEELEVVYSNFGGFEIVKEDKKNIAWAIVAILAVLYITK